MALAGRRGLLLLGKQSGTPQRRVGSWPALRETVDASVRSSCSSSGGNRIIGRSRSGLQQKQVLLSSALRHGLQQGRRGFGSKQLMCHRWQPSRAGEGAPFSCVTSRSSSSGSGSCSSSSSSSGSSSPSAPSSSSPAGGSSLSPLRGSLLPATAFRPPPSIRRRLSLTINPRALSAGQQEKQQQQQQQHNKAADRRMEEDERVKAADRGGTGRGGAGDNSSESGGSGSNTIDIETRRSIWRGREQFASKSKSTMVTALAGNTFICIFKVVAWWSSGSSAMLNTAIHSLVDTLNQGLNLVGLREADNAPDKTHPLGYGKEIYFWSLVSAMGTFWLGFGLSFTHSVQQLMQPDLQVEAMGTWCHSALLFAFVVDGYVLYESISSLWPTKPKDVSIFKHILALRDPTRKAVIYEDAASCVGVVVALIGTTASHVLQNPIYDTMAGFGISFLLGFMGYKLMELNRKYLVGMAVDEEITRKIIEVMKKRPSIDAVSTVQSQWVSPWNFSFKAEADFDGTFVAAYLLPHYQDKFMLVKDTEDLNVLLAFYAEDVLRVTEREIRLVEAEIRKVYPEAAFIDIEPDSKHYDQLAIEMHERGPYRRAERESLNRMLLKMAKDNTIAAPVESGKSGDRSPGGGAGGGGGGGGGAEGSLAPWSWGIEAEASISSSSPAAAASPGVVTPKDKADDVWREGEERGGENKG